jgi:hypothetical protein
MQAVQVDRTSPLADVRWRAWVREHPILAALAAGFVATQMATIVGYFLNAVGLPQLNWPVVNGGLVAPGSSVGAQFAAGAFVHTIDGIVFALLFAVLVWGKIPLPNTSIGNVTKGIIYSLVLAVISAGVLVPYVYFQKVGLDIFSFGLEGPLPQPGSIGQEVAYTDIGWRLPFAVLVWHLVYGFFLGALYDPSGDLATRTSPTAPPPAG